jgi:hypothetical protein
LTLDHAGPFRSARLRLLPWAPRLRDPGITDASGLDIGGGDDLGVGLLLILVVLALPVLVVLALFSLELLALLVVLPFLLAGQLLGLLPWQIAVRGMDGQKHYVSVKGTRAMLEALRHYRSLVQTSRS